MEIDQVILNGNRASQEQARPYRKKNDVGGLTLIQAKASDTTEDLAYDVMYAFQKQTEVLFGVSTYSDGHSGGQAVTGRWPVWGF